MQKTYLKIAGIINLLTAFVHLIAGQEDLVNPLLESNLTTQQQGEWFAVWHIITILLFLTSYYLLKIGFEKRESKEFSILQFIGVLYVLLGIPFIVACFWFSIFAPQFILLMPVGVLVLVGIKKK